MSFSQSHGLVHVIEVRAVETASDVGYVDLGHQAFVVAHLVEAESLAHVAIDHDHLSVVLVPAAAFERNLRKPTSNPANETPAGFSRRLVHD
jgi:hypothetical protein